MAECINFQFGAGENKIIEFSIPLQEFDFTIPAYTLELFAMPYPCGDWSCANEVCTKWCGWKSCKNKCTCYIWSPNWCYEDLAIPVYPDIQFKFTNFSIDTIVYTNDTFVDFRDAINNLELKVNCKIDILGGGISIFDYTIKDAEATVDDAGDIEVFLEKFSFEYDFYGIVTKFTVDILLKVCLKNDFCSIEFSAISNIKLEFGYDGVTYNDNWRYEIPVYTYDIC
jgi:hypothetical protein